MNLLREIPERVWTIALVLGFWNYLLSNTATPFEGLSLYLLIGVLLSSVVLIASIVLSTYDTHTQFLFLLSSFTVVIIADAASAVIDVIGKHLKSLGTDVGDLLYSIQLHFSVSVSSSIHNLWPLFAITLIMLHFANKTPARQSP